MAVVITQIPAKKINALFWFGGGAKNESGKDAVKQETALPCARLKEDEERHPQGYSHMRGWLEKYRRKCVSKVTQPEHDCKLN